MSQWLKYHYNQKESHTCTPPLNNNVGNCRTGEKAGAAQKRPIPKPDTGTVRPRTKPMGRWAQQCRPRAKPCPEEVLCRPDVGLNLGHMESSLKTSQP